MTAQEFDLFTSRAARDQGIATVSAKAGKWIDDAVTAVQRIPPGREVTGEDVRQFVLAGGLPPPHHHNAWGALIRTAVVRGLLVDTGRTGSMTAKKSHARRTPIYKRGE